MPAIKAKQVRLIDILNTINQQEVVLITFNDGRNSCYAPSIKIEETFRNELGDAVKAITCSNGILDIFI